MKRSMGWWWEAVTLLLAANSILFGYLGLRTDDYPYALLAGFLPGLFLVLAVLVHNRARGTATALALAGSLGAAATFWMVYPIVLGLVVVVGGFASGKIGPRNPQPA